MSPDSNFQMTVNTGLYDTMRWFSTNAFATPISVFILDWLAKGIPMEWARQLILTAAGRYASFLYAILPLAKPGLFTRQFITGQHLNELFSRSP